GHRPRRGEIETDTALMAMIGRQQSALKAALARDRQLDAARKVSRFFQRHDVLLSPSLGLPPVRVGGLIPKGAEGAVGHFGAGVEKAVPAREPAVEISA